jgi:hypothetical protein
VAASEALAHLRAKRADALKIIDAARVR